MTADDPLRVGVFLDSRPGHRKQTLGIIDSLRQLTEIRTLEIEVPHLSTTGEILKWAQYFLNPHTACGAELDGCDLLIGTGSRTHIPMLACKKKYNIPVVTCMGPSPLLRHRFDLCFIPQHDGIPPGRNIMHTDGPPNRSRSKNLHDWSRGLILIGGRDEKSHRWNDGELNKAVATLVATEKDLTWTISSSPRTPSQTNTSLAGLAAQFDNMTFVPFADTAPGWIEQEYERNKTVWVTADSISMIFEALTAGCRVGVLPVAWKHKNNKFQRCIDNLRRKELVFFLADWEAGRSNWDDSADFDEARRCAREILKRWWPNRLQ